jgi:hypothetical protein
MFLVVEKEDFSSCSHTIQKTFSSYFELPHYLFLYDCLLLGKFKLFKKKFLMCWQRSWFIFVMTCLLLLRGKKGFKKKNELTFFLMNYHSCFKDGILRETQSSKKDID